MIAEEQLEACYSNLPDESTGHEEQDVAEYRRTPIAFQQQGKLFLEEGAQVPTDICIHTGLKALKSVPVSLRNPNDPRTWFGSSPKIEAGLSQKALEEMRVGQAITYSALAMGGIILVVGIVSLSIGSILAGCIALAGAGFFRARVPVTSPNPKSEPVEIEGVAPKFLNRISATPYE